MCLSGGDAPLPLYASYEATRNREASQPRHIVLEINAQKTELVCLRRSTLRVAGIIISLATCVNI